jgi:hypothetical protein
MEFWPRAQSCLLIITLPAAWEVARLVRLCLKLRIGPIFEVVENLRRIHDETQQIVCVGLTFVNLGGSFCWTSIRWAMNQSW